MLSRSSRRPLSLAFNMKFLLSGVVFVIFAASSNLACSTAEYPTHLDGKYVSRPNVVKLFIGGAFGPSYEVLSDGFTVRYKKGNNMFLLKTKKGINLTPSLKQWSDFLNTLDSIDAWNWKPRYANTNILDGTSWRFIMVDPDKRIINSSGSNAYPEVLMSSWRLR